MQRIVYLLIFFAFIMCSVDSIAQVIDQKRANPVIVSTVVTGDFFDQVEALGTTRANESVVITPDRVEKIAEIYFEDGQKIKQGDLLVKLDDVQEQAELRASEAFTRQAQTSYNRAKGLSGNSALPKATLQERLAALKQAQATTEGLKAALKSYEITAPFDGVLGLREVSVGALVQPGNIITTIDDLSQIKVDFDVPSVFLKTLKPGLLISGYIEAFGSREFEGTVNTVNTQIDPITRTVKVRAIMPNDDGVLKPGLLMSINLSKNPRTALLIPEEALIKRSNENFVYVVKQADGKMIAKKTPVQIGARNPGTIEVLSGINEGDKIVVHGTVRLRGNEEEVIIRAEENGNIPLNELLKQKPENTNKAL